MPPAVGRASPTVVGWTMTARDRRLRRGGESRTFVAGLLAHRPAVQSQVGTRKKNVGRSHPLLAARNGRGSDEAGHARADVRVNQGDLADGRCGPTPPLAAGTPVVRSLLGVRSVWWTGNR